MPDHPTIAALKKLPKPSDRAVDRVRLSESSVAAKSWVAQCALAAPHLLARVAELEAEKAQRHAQRPIPTTPIRVGLPMPIPPDDCASVVERRLLARVAELEAIDGERAALAELHILCADAGIPPGHIVARVGALVAALEAARVAVGDCSRNSSWASAMSHSSDSATSVLIRSACLPPGPERPLRLKDGVVGMVIERSALVVGSKKSRRPAREPGRRGKGRRCATGGDRGHGQAAFLAPRRGRRCRRGSPRRW